MKKKVCPFISSICGGGNSTRNLAINETFNSTVSIKGLPEGRTCMYRIKSTCGKIKVKHETMREVLTQLKEKNDDWNDKDRKEPEP